MSTAGATPYGRAEAPYGFAPAAKLGSPQTQVTEADVAFNIKQHMKLPPQFKGFVSTEVEGEGGHNKILRYDMKLLVQYSACGTILSKGTVFTMDNTAIRTTGMMVAMVGITALGVVVEHVAAGNFQGLTEIDIGPLQLLANQVSSFVPLALALFVGLTLTRWWSLRTHALAKVFDSLANTCMLVASELSDDKWLELREGIMKYGMASVELLVQAARETGDVNHLVQLDLLTDVEAEFMKEYKLLWQRPMVVWAWIMHIITNAMDHDKTPVPSRQAVIGQCLHARDGMATINMHLDTQLPFAYVHFITLLVNMQNLLLAITSGLTLATALPAADYFIVIQQVLTTAIIVFCYQALLTISYTIEDPFGDDVLDFPIRAYKAYVASIVDAMMGAGRGCPAVSSDGQLWRPPKPNNY